MDYSKILQELQEASLFDLYRLNSVIEDEMQNPKRIQELKQRLRVGQIITWFDADKHLLQEAEIIKFKRTRCLVQNLGDQARWDIAYASINSHDVDISIKTKQKFGLSKHELKVGDKVTFMDKNNMQLYGKVIKLNQKSVGVEVDGLRWRVSYDLLAKIVEIDSEVIEKPLFVIER